MLFIYPDIDYTEKLKFSSHIGLGYICAYLKSKNITSEILRLNRAFKLKELIEYILEKKYKFIGFTVYYNNLDICKQIAQEIKRKDKSRIIVFGGPMASSIPEILIRKKYIDICVCGYAEHTIYHLLTSSKKEYNSIPNVITKENYRQSRQIIYSQFLSYKNLDFLPSPYLSKVLSPEDALSCGIVFSRGCPFSCDFCLATKLSNNKIFFHSINRVISELKYINKKVKNKKIRFNDSTFSFNKNLTEKLLKEIIKNKINLKFHIDTRIDFLDEKMLNLMAKANIKSIVLGIETFNPLIYSKIKKYSKNLNIKKKYIQICEIANKLNIEIITSLIFGLPGDTLKQANKSIKIAEFSNSKTVNYNFLVPLSQTKVFNQISKKHKVSAEMPFIIKKSYYNYDINKINIIENKFIQGNYFFRKLSSKFLNNIFLNKEKNILFIKEKQLDDKNFIKNIIDKINIQTKLTILSTGSKNIFYYFKLFKNIIPHRNIIVAYRLNKTIISNPKNYLIESSIILTSKEKLYKHLIKQSPNLFNTKLFLISNKLEKSLYS